MPFAVNALDAARVYFEDDGGDSARGDPRRFLDPVDLVVAHPTTSAWIRLAPTR